MPHIWDFLFECVGKCRDWLNYQTKWIVVVLSSWREGLESIVVPVEYKVVERCVIRVWQAAPPSVRIPRRGSSSSQADWMTSIIQLPQSGAGPWARPDSLDVDRTPVFLGILEPVVEVALSYSTGPRTLPYLQHPPLNCRYHPHTPSGLYTLKNNSWINGHFPYEPSSE